MIRNFILLAFVVLNTAVLAQDDFLWADFYGTRSQVTHITTSGESELYLLLKGRDKKIISVKKNSGDTIASMKISGDYNLSVEDLKTDKNGNAYVLGNFRQKINIGSYSYEAEKHMLRTFLARITPGEELKEEDVLILDGLMAKKLDFTPDNDFIIGGHFRHRAEVFGNKLEGQLDDVFILKLSPEYEFKWIDSYKGAGDNHLTGLDVDENGNIFASCSFSVSIIIHNDTIELPRGTSKAQLIWRMDQQKIIAWRRTVEGLGYKPINIKNLALAGDKIIFAADFHGEWKMNSRVYKAMRKTDVVIFSMDKSGLKDTVLFHIKSPFDVTPGGLVASGNKLILIGSFFKRIHIDDQIYASHGDTTAFSIKADIFFLKFNTEGRIDAFKVFGAEEADQGKNLLLDNGTVYMVGNISATPEFGSLKLEVPKYQSSGFVAALKTDLINSGAGSKTSAKPCKTPPQPEISAGSTEYYDVNIQWKPVKTAKYYHLKVAKDKEMQEVVAEFNNMAEAAGTSKKVEGLWTGEKYYFTLKAENECGKVSGSEVHQLETKCNTETYFFTSRSENVCSMWFTVDCKGEVQESGISGKMGTVAIRDSMIIIPGGRSPGTAGGDTGNENDDSQDAGTDKPKTDKPGLGKSLIAGAISRADQNCEKGEIAVKTTVIKEQQLVSKTICISVEEQEEGVIPAVSESDSKCNGLDDRERIICLAKEGMAEVDKRMKRMEELKKKMSSMVSEETSTESAAYKEAAKLWEKYELIHDSLEPIREHYEALINQIATKRTITLNVKNSSGINVSNGTVVKARWNKYDDAMKFPGPQLIIEFNVSGFSRKKIEKSWNRCLSEHVVFMDFVSKTKSYPTFALLLYPCLQVKGILSTNIAVLDKLENLDHLHFTKTDKKGYNCDSWSKCKENMKSTADEKEMTYKDALKQEDGNEQKSDLLFYLALIKNMEYAPEPISGEQKVMDWAGTSMEGPYFDVFGDPQKATDFMKKHHQTIQEGTPYSRYSFYYIYTAEYLEGENQECIEQARKLVEMYRNRLK